MGLDQLLRQLRLLKHQSQFEVLAVWPQSEGHNQLNRPYPDFNSIWIVLIIVVTLKSYNTSTHYFCQQSGTIFVADTRN